MDQEEFEHLSLEEQEQIFHKTSFREKGDLILHSRDPIRLAQSLSQEELYLVTREMDLEERSEILRYASLPQLFFISDIDCWKKDRISAKGFVRWLEVLEEADEQRLLAWLVEMDYETVVSGFRNLIQVIKPETEYPTDEVLGDSPYFTLDERYFILVTEENIEIVRRAIEVLYENHRGRYAAILEGLLGELDYELEEEAYQKRGIRLAERGFPDPETAHHIFRPLSKSEFEKFPRKNGKHFYAEVKDDPNVRAPHYLTFWSEERLFLDEVLLFMREGPREVLEGIEEELAWLSNKLVSCEGIDFASEEKVRRGVNRARSLLSLGLEILSEKDLSRAREVMSERWLEIIFRWGVTSLIDLREKASKIVETHWKGSYKPFLAFLNPPYEQLFRGLFQIVPEYFDISIQGEPEPLRDFRNLQDLSRTQQAILQIERIHEFLSKEFPYLFHRLNLAARQGEHKVSLFSLLGTIFAHFVIQGKVSIEPLSEKEVLSFLKEGFTEKASQKTLSKELKEKFLSYLSPHQERDSMRPFLALALENMEQELARLDPSYGVDSRFIECLHISEKKVHEKSRKPAQSF
ncbi:MAG: hypothetical protein HY447_00155 [Candidatus Omnitrophica bacterium]|nr:hypothetical protein [Candidatus Omnitrophota bacterium]